MNYCVDCGYDGDISDDNFDVVFDADRRGNGGDGDDEEEDEISNKLSNVVLGPKIVAPAYYEKMKICPLCCLAVSDFDDVKSIECCHCGVKFMEHAKETLFLECIWCYTFCDHDHIYYHHEVCQNMIGKIMKI